MKRPIYLTAVMLAAFLLSPAYAGPISRIYQAVKPFDITLPPARYRAYVGPINVVFVDDIFQSCFQKPGMITIGCNVTGAHGDVAILPDPKYFDDEELAKALVPMSDTERAETIRALACTFPRQAYARLACHEVIGHQLGHWPANHPK